MWLNALNRRWHNSDWVHKWQAGKVLAARQALEATHGPIPTKTVRLRSAHSMVLDATTGTALIRGIDQYGNPVEELIVTT